MSTLVIQPLTDTPQTIAELCSLLVDTVARGGSVSFMHPLPRVEAEAFWRRSLAAAACGERIVLGAWLLKFLLFLILIFVLGDVDALDRTVLFLTLVVAVLGGLVTDLVGVARARVPYVDEPRAPRP